MAFRASLRRWHMWLGWLVIVPMLFWTVSGFVMVARPNAEVRGTALLRDPPQLALKEPAIAPSLDGLRVASMALEPRAVVINGTRLPEDTQNWSQWVAKEKP